jgi:hypothetical protein
VGGCWCASAFAKSVQGSRVIYEAVEESELDGHVVSHDVSSDLICTRACG